MCAIADPMSNLIAVSGQARDTAVSPAALECGPRIAEVP